MNGMKVEETIGYKGTGCCGIAYLTGVRLGNDPKRVAYINEKGAYEYGPLEKAVTTALVRSGYTNNASPYASKLEDCVLNCAAICWSDVGKDSSTGGEMLKDVFQNAGFTVLTTEVGNNRRPGHDGHYLRHYMVFGNGRSKTPAEAKKLSLVREYTSEQEEQERASKASPEPSGGVRARVRILRANAGARVRVAGRIGRAKRNIDL